jgi:hypothetical protein
VLGNFTVFTRFFMAAFILISNSSVSSSEPMEDPSLVPLFASDATPAYRFRAYGDINKDGIKDLIVSEDMSNLSQNGLRLFIYLADSNGKYLFYDTVYSLPDRLKFERDGRGVRMWNSWHVSAQESTLYYDIMTDSGFIEGGSIVIFDGDAGGKISRAVVDTVYNNSDVDFIIERYRIINGRIEFIRN